MSQISPTLFRAYDIRGVVDRDLTEAAARLIGRAFGSSALARGQNAVAVGRDGRLSGPRLVAALTEGLLASGIDVIDVGCVPTPVVYYAAEELGTRTCIAVTGSHNPPDYNGLKMVIGGETLYGDSIQDLRTRIESDDFANGRGSRREEDVSGRYLARIAGDVELARPLRLAVDCGNGVAGELAPQLLERLGCSVEPLYCEIDGRFPNHHPNPSEPENLKDLIIKVRTDGLDLGLAFDGDGDRLGVIDAEGRVVWADRQMMLYAADVLSRHPGATILYDVKCSRHLGDQIAAHGGDPLMWKTGHSLVKAKMRETGALLGGEMSGHIFFKERWYGFDDALYTAARLLEILSRDPRTPTEVFAALPDSLNTPELNVHFAEEGAHFDFMRRLTGQADFGDARLTTIDGLRADYAHGWGLVRPSNTTPSLVIRFEADDEAHLHEIQAVFRQQMLAAEPSLNLPF
ncbi:phosphomannomutase/phosphoglucomutase [Acidihalobacter prosperus]